MAYGGGNYNGRYFVTMLKGVVTDRGNQITVYFGGNCKFTRQHKVAFGKGGSAVGRSAVHYSVNINHSACERRRLSIDRNQSE
jgi:hypothetical protein